MSFRPVVDLGHILTLVLMMAGIAAFVYGLKSLVLLLEQQLAGHEADDRLRYGQIEGTLKEIATSMSALAEMVRRQGELSARLEERINDRLHRLEVVEGLAGELRAAVTRLETLMEESRQDRELLRGEIKDIRKWRHDLSEWLGPLRLRLEIAAQRGAGGEKEARE